MVARRIRRNVSKYASACTRWGAAIAYLTLSLGIQLPLPAAAKNSAQPYPCMNHPCGCASAEECWRHCCCTTLEERLRWARENHVTPPDYALAEARARGIDWEGFCKVGPEHSSRICHDGEEIKPTCCKHSHCDSQHGQSAARHQLAAGAGLQGRCAELDRPKFFVAAAGRGETSGFHGCRRAVCGSVAALLFDFSSAADSAAANSRRLMR